MEGTLTPEQRERAIKRLMDLYPMTVEDAAARVDSIVRGLRERAEGKRIPLSQFRKDLGL